MTKGILIFLLSIVLILIGLGVIDVYRANKNMKPIFVMDTTRIEGAGYEVTVYKNPIYRVIHVTGNGKNTWEFRFKIDNPAYENVESYSDYVD